MGEIHSSNVALKKNLLLFGFPTHKQSVYGTLFSLVMVYLVICCWLAIDFVSDRLFFMVSSVLLLSQFLMGLYISNLNIFFIFRLFLIWILIIAAALVRAIYQGDVAIAPFGLEYQTSANTKILVMAGMLSLAGSTLGWSLCHLKSLRWIARPQLNPGHRRALTFAGGAIALAFGALYVWKAGGFVGNGKTYADGQEGFAMVFGVFNVFQFFGISLMLLGGAGFDSISKKVIIFSILTLILGILVGSRADYLPQVFLLIALFFNRQIVEVFENRHYAKLMLWSLCGVVGVGLGYMAASFVAIWRTGISPSEVLTIMARSEKGHLINDVYGHPMLYLETGNMMLGGLFSAIVQVNEKVTGLLLGQSYANYFLIAPPAFLGLPRPLGYEWHLDFNGKIMSQGGLFEVAEAYWNFGLAGCFIVGFVISYALAVILRKGISTCNYFFLSAYLVCGFMGFRSIWYQNFSYFRILTIFLCLYLLAYFYCRWFIRDHYPVGRHG